MGAGIERQVDIEEGAEPTESHNPCIWLSLCTLGSRPADT